MHPAVNEVQSAILPYIQSQFASQKFGETDSSPSDSSIYSGYDTSTSRDETNRHNQR